MIRKITCTNADNVSLVFSNRFAPLMLIDAEGLYTVEADVNITENGLGDGGNYIGTNIKVRNIVLTIASKSDHAKNRNILFQLFLPKTAGTLIYQEIDGNYEEVREIDYYVEKIYPQITSNVCITTVSLLCGDPYFRDLMDTTMIMTGWNSLFEFSHEFVEQKEELAEQKKEKIVTIESQYTVPRIGMVIEMLAEGDVTNPSMIHLESNSFIKVGTEINPFIMSYGDKLIISTESNKKNAYLVRNGVKESVNEYIDEKSTYIQIQSGNNTFRYAAEIGEDNLLVSFLYRRKYLGV